MQHRSVFFSQKIVWTNKTKLARAQINRSEPPWGQLISRLTTLRIQQGKLLQRVSSIFLIRLISLMKARSCYLEKVITEMITTRLRKGIAIFIPQIDPSLSWTRSQASWCATPFNLRNHLRSLFIPINLIASTRSLVCVPSSTFHPLTDGELVGKVSRPVKLPL